MSDFQPLTRSERAKFIADNAKRLQRLCDLNAPEVIIESARWSLCKRLAAFPALSDGVEARERVESEMWNEEQEFLHKHGYYDGIVPPDEEQV